jgi:hypothetical protein
MARCYDPRRMSSTPRLTRPTLRGLGLAARRVGGAIAWTVLLALLAASGAGLVGQTFHAPGSPARAELTWPGDASIQPTLDAAAAQLEAISKDVDDLATRAKTALGEVTSSDPTRLRTALLEGGLIAARIDSQTKALRTSLVGLPGDGPTAAIDFGNPTLVRRAAILAAIDAAAGVASQWQSVTGRAVDAAEVTSLISEHDQTVLSAAQQGVAGQFAAAIPILDTALATIDDIHTLRVRLIAGNDDTVLDEWIQRNTTYDKALQKLYAALVKSKGDATTLDVQVARREEQLAFKDLPPDRRTIIVIVSEVARGGLTQAVLAIEDAHSRIDDALGTAAG